MLARFEVITSERTTLTSRNLPKARIAGESIIEIEADIGVAMGILPPRRQMVFANLVAYRAQADAQHLRGVRPVARRRLKGHFEQALLHGFERHPSVQPGKTGLRLRFVDSGRLDIRRKFHVLVR